MKSINIFSQRYKNLILNKKIVVSISSGIRQTIYNLFLKYDRNDCMDSYIDMVYNELMIYQPKNKIIKGKNISDIYLEEFLLEDYPSSTLDAIEVFANISKNKEFEKDINNIFYNNKLPYELKNGEIKIINSIEVPSVDNAVELKKEIDSKIVNKEFTFVVDRLHTYYGYFLIEKCNQFCLSIPYDDKGHIILSKAVKIIDEYLLDKNIISEFEGEALKRMNSLIDKFNSIRNNETYSHPNQIIDNDSAEFVVKIFSASMEFLDKCCKRF